MEVSFDTIRSLLTLIRSLLTLIRSLLTLIRSTYKALCIVNILRQSTFALLTILRTSVSALGVHSSVI